MNPNQKPRRHFGKYAANKHEVVIIGHREVNNELIIVFLTALPTAEYEDLLRVVTTDAAQNVDYLLDNTNKVQSILGAAPHINRSQGKTWEQVLIERAQTPNEPSVVKCPIHHVIFEDDSQKQFFEGIGESIEPLVDAERKRRKGEPTSNTPNASSEEVEKLSGLMEKLMDRMDKIEGKNADDVEKSNKKENKKTSKAA